MTDNGSFNMLSGRQGTISDRALFHGKLFYLFSVEIGDSDR